MIEQLTEKDFITLANQDILPPGTERSFFESVKPEQAADFLAKFIDYVFKVQFSVMDNPNLSYEGRLSLLVGQLNTLLKISPVAIQLESVVESAKDTDEVMNSAQSGYEDRFYFHDVKNPIYKLGNYASMLIDNIGANSQGVFDDVENRRMIEVIQMLIEELLEVNADFRGGDASLETRQVTAQKLLDYILKVKKQVETMVTSLKKNGEPVKYTYNEKVKLLINGKLRELQLERLNAMVPNITFRFENSAEIPPERLSKMELAFTGPLFVRIFDNVMTNMIKAYQKKLEESHYFTDVEPRLDVIISWRANGLFMIFEDQATGFPAETTDVTAVSDYDQKLCREYTPEVYKTSWTKNIKGTGRGIAGYAKLISGIPGASFRCLSTLDKYHVPQGSRVEIFLPFKQD